jgi:hypothetical protein
MCGLSISLGRPLRETIQHTQIGDRVSKNPFPNFTVTLKKHLWAACSEKKFIFTLKYNNSQYAITLQYHRGIYNHVA